MKASRVMWKALAMVLVTGAFAVMGMMPRSVQGAVHTKYALANYQAKKLKVREIVKYNRTLVDKKAHRGL